MCTNYSRCALSAYAVQLHGRRSCELSVRLQHRHRKAGTFIALYGTNNSHWQLPKLPNSNRKVFSVRYKCAPQPEITVAMKLIYWEARSGWARMRVSLMSPKKYDCGAMKWEYTTVSWCTALPKYIKDSDSALSLLSQLSLQPFSLLSFLYLPASKFKKRNLSVAGTHCWLIEISDWEAYMQAERKTWSLECWHSLSLFLSHLFLWCLSTRPFL